MKIGVLNGKLSSINGGHVGSDETIHRAMLALLKCPAVPDDFTGVLDTDTKLFEPAPPTVALSDAAMGAHDVRRYTFKQDGMPGNVKPVESPQGEFVFYSAYKELQRKHDDVWASADRLKAELNAAKADLDKASAANRNIGDEYKIARDKLQTALGLGQGWGSAGFPFDQLIERVAENVRLFKAKEDDLMHANQSITVRQNELDGWRMRMGDVLGVPSSTLTADYTYDAVKAMREASVADRNELHFARDFAVQVKNLLRLDKNAHADAVYFTIKDMTETIHALESQQAVHEHMYGAAEPITVEPVGRAVFECTFEWARDNWDLFVDKFVWGTVNNPVSKETGYIKVVATGK